MRNVYHSGEKEVQARAGVRVMSDRIANSIQSTIPPAAQDFLRRQPFVFIGSVDAAGSVWASVLTGAPGFVHATGDRIVRMNALPVPGDPLNENWLEQKQIGLLAIEFSTRQRMRVNGSVERGTDGAMYITTDQVYSNCPKYIQARTLEETSTPNSGEPLIQKSHHLTQQQQRWIVQSDTFVIASSHPQAGTDVSHRGGNPGFVQIKDAGRLVWPDYAGNTMFQTLGNIAAYPYAGLLFIDFDRGNTLQITGKATIHWRSDAERFVEFHIEETIEIQGAFPSQWKFLGYSPHNPSAS